MGLGAPYTLLFVSVFVSAVYLFWLDESWCLYCSEVFVAGAQRVV